MRDNSAVVALIGFEGNGRFGRRRFKPLGEVENYRVEYCRLYRDEAAFAALPMVRQRALAEKCLAKAMQRGAVLLGVPYVWRPLFAGFLGPELVDARPLLLRLAIADLAADLQGLRGKSIAVAGVEGGMARLAVELLLRQGAKPVLQGRRAAALSDWFYRQEGIALPVAQTERLLAGCAGRLILRRAGEFLPPHHFDLRDRKVELEGEYAAPFADGCFGVGLAAAMIMAGARLKVANPQDNTAIAIDKAAELAV